MKSRHSIFTIAVLLGFFLVGGCATAPAVSNKNTDQISGVTKMVLVSPIVECIDANTGNPSTLDEQTEIEVKASLVNGFRSEFAKKNVVLSEVSEIVEIDTGLNDDLGGIYRTIKQNSFSLDAGQKERLSWITSKTGASHLLFSRCRLHKGPKGFWDPFSGAITSDSSRIVLECHLYDIQDERVAWTRAIQDRASPNKGPLSISNMLPVVIETLELK